MKQKLMNKWIAAAVVMMVGLTLSLASASANKSAVTPGSQSFTGRALKVSLGCQPTSLNSDVATQVKITNTTLNFPSQAPKALYRSRRRPEKSSRQ